MANQSIQDVLTGKVRLSYVNLFAPYASLQGAEAKYSTTILLPKGDIRTKQKIDGAINAAILDGIGSKWNGVRPPILAIPVYDGDGQRPSDGMPFGEECKGHFVFKASSKLAPEVVDLAKKRIVNQREIYSGIYARVWVSFFPYASNGRNGIGCSLGPVQKLQEGEPLGVRISAAEAFSEEPAGYEYIQSQAPAYVQATPQLQPYYNPQMPSYAHQAVYPSYLPQQTQLDPITGAPITGGVMGI